MVEFALVFPLFMVLLVAIIEYGFLLNAALASSFASRDASLVAAEAGNASGADCAILRKVEQDVPGPSDPNDITTVRIFWADPATGDVRGGNVNTYTRSPSLTISCTLGGSTFTLPYDQTTNGYAEANRCNVINGSTCALGHTGLDTIGVEITYVYTWHTPLKALLGFQGPGWTIIRSNAMEIEPVL